MRARGGCEAGGGCSWRTCNALPAAATCRGSAALPPWSPALRTHTSTQNGEVRACGLGEFRGVAVQGRMLTCHAAYLHRPSARAAHCRCVTCTPSQREQAQGARTAKAMITTNAAASRCTLAATRAAATPRLSGTPRARLQSRQTSLLHRREPSKQQTNEEIAMLVCKGRCCCVLPPPTPKRVADAQVPSTASYLPLGTSSTHATRPSNRCLTKKCRGTDSETLHFFLRHRFEGRVTCVEVVPSGR